MFPIENVIQFNLEHRGDYESMRLTFDRDNIIGRDKTDLCKSEPCLQQEGDYKVDAVEEGMRNRQ